MKEELQKEYDELAELLAQPDAFKDPNIAEKNRRHAELEEILQTFADIDKTQKILDDTKQMALGSDELSELAKEELPEHEKKLSEFKNKLREALTPKDPNDPKNAIMEIRAGAGGDEASLFAGDLFRMYTRYCERHKYKLDLVAESPSEVGGFKEVIFEIKADGAYGNMKYESGVHRVQRVPTTESSGRIHTSTVTVAVMPEAEEHDIKIDDKDIKVDVYRSSGHGGQSVNTTDSAVRITHTPTGIVVTCQDEKSQIKNRAKAMNVLRSRLLAKQVEEQQAAESDHRRKLIGTGDRSEKIRTYNFPQDRVTDHRIGYSRSNIPAMIDGDFDDVVKELKAKEVELASE